MFDADLITGFEWDSGNTRKSADKHEVTQTEAEQVFADPRLLMVEDTRHSGVERRFHALGLTAQDRPVHVTFTLRGGGTLIRVISARTMSRKERAIYAQNP